MIRVAAHQFLSLYPEGSRDVKLWGDMMKASTDQDLIWLFQLPIRLSQPMSRQQSQHCCLASQIWMLPGIAACTFPSYMLHAVGKESDRCIDRGGFGWLDTMIR